jgi:hypothetical protein
VSAGAPVTGRKCIATCVCAYVVGWSDFFRERGTSETGWMGSRTSSLDGVVAYSIFGDENEKRPCGLHLPACNTRAGM